VSRLRSVPVLRFEMASARAFGTAGRFRRWPPCKVLWNPKNCTAYFMANMRRHHLRASMNASRLYKVHRTDVTSRIGCNGFFNVRLEGKSLLPFDEAVCIKFFEC